MRETTNGEMHTMGILSSKAATGSSMSVVDLPKPVTTGGRPLMEALLLRRSGREFALQPLPYQVMSNLLWAAYGVNRPKHKGRTAPSAVNAQEIDIYVVLTGGAYCYEPFSHSLQRIVSEDIRSTTGCQDFVDRAPVNLVYAADYKRMPLVPDERRESYASAAAGSIAQNVYLFCASEGLQTVLRAWISRASLKESLALRKEQEILFSQSLGYPPA
jgi:SagB-type dehydrogenase family enzyme